MLRSYFTSSGLMKNSMGFKIGDFELIYINTNLGAAV